MLYFGSLYYMLKIIYIIETNWPKMYDKHEIHIESKICTNLFFIKIREFEDLFETLCETLCEISSPYYVYT